MFQDIATQWGYNSEQNAEKPLLLWGSCSSWGGEEGSKTIAIGQLRLFNILVKIKNNKNAVHFSN